MTSDRPTAAQIAATCFPQLAGRTWLNTAHQAPLPACAQATADAAVRAKARPWELTTERFSGVPRRLKAALARLIDVPPDEPILANSASYGLHLIAENFPWAEGDEVLTMRGDFPSDILPWMAQEPRGVVVHQLRPRGRVLDPDEVAAAIGPRTRLLCLTWVHSLSGWTIELDAIGRICRDAGVVFVVNASQALGVRPLNGSAAPIDAVICAGWKWLLGPYGTGFCWLCPELLAKLRCGRSYWLSDLTSDDLGRAEIDLGARRDPGPARWDLFATANFFQFEPWIASLEMLQTVGVDAARAHAETLVQRLVDGLDRRRWRLGSPEAGPSRSTLVFVEPRDGTDVQAACRVLGEAGVHVAHRAGALRLSPHLCNEADDIDRALAALDALPR